MSLEGGASYAPKKRKVFALEAEPGSLKRIQFALEKCKGQDFEFAWCVGVESARAVFIRNEYDVYIVECCRGSYDGIEFIRQVILDGCKRPVIIVTDSGDAKDEVSSLAAGAADCLRNDMLDSTFVEVIIRHAIERTNLQREKFFKQAANFLEFELSMFGRVSACVAHEVNSPLALIADEIWNIRRLLQLGDISQDEMIERIGSIENYSGRVAKIIQSLSRDEECVKQQCYSNVSVRRVVLEALDICSSNLKSHKIEVRVLASASEILMECNPLEVSRVLVNLIHNAIDIVKDLPDRWITFEIANLKNEIAISITDSGFGFADELREQMFSPLLTITGMEGLGPRLSLARSIVEKYGGTLSLNAQSKNTQFCVRLPAYASRPQALRVLLVEDDVDLAELISTELQNAGYAVRAVQNGLKALDLLKSQKIDVLVVDLVIPGIRGDELVRQAESLNLLPNCVIGITGFDQEKLIPRLDASRLFVLQKPFAILDLIHTLEARMRDQPAKVS